MCQNISLSRRGVLFAHFVVLERLGLPVHWYHLLCLYSITRTMNNQYANLHKVCAFHLFKTQNYIFRTQKLLTLGLQFDTIVMLGRSQERLFFYCCCQVFFFVIYFIINKAKKGSLWNLTIYMMKTDSAPEGSTVGVHPGGRGSTAWWSVCGSMTEKARFC